MIQRATIEEWRPTHHPNYDVSNLGRVRSRARGAERLLKPGLTSVGYPSVTFGRGKTQMVHRLVAAAFIGPCPVGQECRHKDDDRTNARADNLEYGTRYENIMDAVVRGRINPPRGEKHRSAQLTTDSVRAIRREREQGRSFRKLGLKWGVGASTVRALISGHTWAHVE